ncbi:hypothetical protein RIEGSTA812A_PEG_161 [invertebrate metagenome]|uniref:Uncharacterized protein n=1 Tax=invertebrate metagenome TaxID=1711999 RepID=A0A484H931_9ZZZZ
MVNVQPWVQRVIPEESIPSIANTSTFLANLAYLVSIRLEKNPCYDC